MQSNNRTSSNEQNNGTTIILTPTSLNATTEITPTPTAAAAAPENDIEAHKETPRVHPEHWDGPKIWVYFATRWAKISQPLALLLILLLVWSLAYFHLPEYAKPNSSIMRILFLIVGAHVAGILATLINLPDMLGMIFFGVLFKNVGFADFAGYERFEAFLREMALINLMLLAGLGLDGHAFRELWQMILRLTLIPSMAEMSIIAVLARFLLDLPWLWGILMGLVITAVSPNVVVTVVLKLKEDHLGMTKGIHTLIYAATTCNDVVAICLFGAMLGIIFPTANLTEEIVQGPVGLGIGLVFGYLYGMMLRYLPYKKANHANGLRFALTLLGGTIAVMGCKAFGYPSGGALGCASLACIANIGWKYQAEKQTPEERKANERVSVQWRLNLLWKFLKPVSFGLIGKEIDFKELDFTVVCYGALLVLIGSAFRLAFAYISSYGGNLTRKERLYIMISGFPKATVQAALGPLALDLVRAKYPNDPSVEYAHTLLLISVLAIIFTAPLGAVLLLRLAPLWLQHSDSDEQDPEFHQPPHIQHSYDNSMHVSTENIIGSDDVTNAPSMFARNLSQRSLSNKGAIIAPAPAPAPAPARSDAEIMGIGDCAAQTKESRYLV